MSLVPKLRASERGIDLVLLKRGFPVLAVLVLLPLVFRYTDIADYLTYFVVRMMILGLYAISYDLLFGYTGILSLGHAFFLGGGQYAVAILMVRLGFPIYDALPGILLAIFVGLVLGWIMGFLASRVKSLLAVLLVTFAVADTLQLVVMTDPGGLTWGENGIAGIPRQTIFGFIDIQSELSFYYLVLVVLCLSFLGLKAITRAPFGDTLLAIRENPMRAQFMGYRINHFRIAAFMISGAFASLAGALAALHEQSVAPEAFGMFVSTDAFIYTVLGGAGTLVGPLMGTAVMLVAQEVFNEIFRTWTIFLGLIYMMVIMFLPNGFFRFLRVSG